MLALIHHAVEFAVYRGVLKAVDRITRLPRHTDVPELERLLCENIALKAQVDALVLELKERRGPTPKVRLRTRALQVFASLITRNNRVFTRRYLSAHRKTLRRWKRRFLGLKPLGRPPLNPEVVRTIVRLKRENPNWGAGRIQQTLRRLGLRVSQPTIQKALRRHGFDPLRRTGRPALERFRSSTRDGLWAFDYMAVRLSNGAWTHVLVGIDSFSRELVALRAYPGRVATSEWTARVVSKACTELGRKPVAVAHDRGSQFHGQFERQMAVQGIEQRWTTYRSPWTNGVVERMIKTLQTELLDHVRCRDIFDLQRDLNDYRRYYNEARPHQSLRGATPNEVVHDRQPLAPVIDLRQYRVEHLTRRTSAHRLLSEYRIETWPLAENPNESDFGGSIQETDLPRNRDQRRIAGLHWP